MDPEFAEYSISALGSIVEGMNYQSQPSSESNSTASSEDTEAVENVFGMLDTISKNLGTELDVGDDPL